MVWQCSAVLHVRAGLVAMTTLLHFPEVGVLFF